MPTLFDNVVSESKVYKGAGRVVYAPKTQAFPVKIEDVIDPSTFVLASGWSDLGATTRDGVTVTRGLEMEEGVEVDQMAVTILSGSPKKWSGQVSATLLHTDVDTLKLAFESPDPVLVSGSQGSQKKLKVGSPKTLTERRLAVIQRHSHQNRYRMLAFRRAILAPEELEIAIQSEEPSKIAVAFDLMADLDIETDDNLFSFFEMSEAI